MTTDLLDDVRDRRTGAPSSPSSRDPVRADLVCDLVVEAGLGRALNVIGEREAHRLEVLADGAVACVEVAADLAHACAVEVAAAAARGGLRCGTWTVRLVVVDDADGADVLLREWRSTD